MGEGEYLGKGEEEICSLRTTGGSCVCRRNILGKGQTYVWKANILFLIVSLSFLPSAVVTSFYRSTEFFLEMVNVDGIIWNQMAIPQTRRAESAP